MSESDQDPRQESPAKPQSQSRREFLKKAALLTGGSIAVWAAGKSIEKYLPTQESQKIILGGTERLLKVGRPEYIHLEGVNWYPDGHTSYLRDKDGSAKVWVAGGPYGYMAQGPHIEELNQVQEVIGPGKEDDFDSDYAAPGSVILGKNENELLMFYHGEHHPKKRSHFPFNAGVGLAISKDGGKTWDKQGLIIEGKNNQPAVDRVYGAGQPSAVIKDGNIYLYYIDWNGEDSDAIHLARAPLSSNGMPNSWETFYNGEFTTDPKKSSPVIKPPTENDYSALPGISWNTYLNKFLGIFESREGFNITTSDDGIKWSDSVPILQTKTANNNPKRGDKWNSYPTLLSTTESSDRVTNQNMVLICSEGKWQESPHSMTIRPVQLT